MMNQSHGTTAWKNFPMASLSKPNKKVIAEKMPWQIGHEK